MRYKENCKELKPLKENPKLRLAQRARSSSVGIAGLFQNWILCRLGLRYTIPPKALYSQLQGHHDFLSLRWSRMK